MLVKLSKKLKTFHIDKEILDRDIFHYPLNTIFSDEYIINIFHPFYIHNSKVSFLRSPLKSKLLYIKTVNRVKIFEVDMYRYRATRTIQSYYPALA